MICKRFSCSWCCKQVMIHYTLWPGCEVSLPHLRFQPLLFSSFTIYTPHARRTVFTRRGEAALCGRSLSSFIGVTVCFTLATWQNLGRGPVASSQIPTSLTPHARCSLCTVFTSGASGHSKLPRNRAHTASKKGRSRESKGSAGGGGVAGRGRGERRDRGRSDKCE